MELDSRFEDDLRDATLAQAEGRLRESLGPRLEQVARTNWQRYAADNDYDIDHVWEDIDGPTITRTGDHVSAHIEWPGLTALFEFGVSPHIIEGNPLLHFYWAEKDQWVTTESVNWGSETGGIPAARAIRNALRDVEREARR
jgi:hypothetical protein